MGSHWDGVQWFDLAAAALSAPGQQSPKIGEYPASAHVFLEGQGREEFYATWLDPQCIRHWQNAGTEEPHRLSYVTR
jgi:hypothetical protein